MFAGHRIGKGEGFSDLEYGLMEATGLVSEKTVIVTTVHDEQVCKIIPRFRQKQLIDLSLKVDKFPWLIASITLITNNPKSRVKLKG